MNLPDPDTVYGSGHIPLYRDFYNAIIKNEKPYIDGNEGKKAVELVLGIYKSAKEDKIINFPFEFSSAEMKF